MAVIYLAGGIGSSYLDDAHHRGDSTSFGARSHQQRGCQGDERSPCYKSSALVAFLHRLLPETATHASPKPHDAVSLEIDQRDEVARAIGKEEEGLSEPLHSNHEQQDDCGGSGVFLTAKEMEREARKLVVKLELDETTDGRSGFVILTGDQDAGVGAEPKQQRPIESGASLRLRSRSDDTAQGD